MSGNGNGFRSTSATISTQYDAPTNTIQAEARTEFIQPPSQSYGAPGIDTSIETTNSIYSDVPETIQQGYDSNGGYAY